MSIEWRKPCEHGRYEAHTTWKHPPPSSIGTRIQCPGGSSVTTKDLEEALGVGKEVRLFDIGEDVGWRYVSAWRSMPYVEWVKEMTPLLIREEQ